MKEKEFWDDFVNVEELNRLIEEYEAEERADFCKGDLY